MPDDISNAVFRPQVSAHDWLIVLHALDAYRHNSSYRRVYDRMVQEALRAGIPVPQDLLRVDELA